MESECASGKLCNDIKLLFVAGEPSAFASGPITVSSPLI
jgi:hypothetical protein